MARNQKVDSAELIEAMLAQIGMFLEDASIFAIDQKSAQLLQRLEGLETLLKAASTLHAAAAAIYELTAT